MPKSKDVIIPLRILKKGQQPYFHVAYLRSCKLCLVQLPAAFTDPTETFAQKAAGPATPMISRACFATCTLLLSVEELITSDMHENQASLSTSTLAVLGFGI